MNWNPRKALRRQARLDRSLHLTPPVGHANFPLRRTPFAVIPPEQIVLVPSRWGILDQRRDLHELDLRTYTIETGYTLQQRLSEKSLGRVF